MNTLDQLDLLIKLSKEHHFYSTPHGELHYITMGTSLGVPVVFLHGANIGIGQWYPNIEVFTKEHPVYALDMYNAGESVNLPIEKQIPSYYKDAVLNFLKDCVREPAILIGHSFGGYLAGIIAIEHPELVKGIILSDAIGIGNSTPIKQQLLRLPIISDLLLLGPLSPSETHINQFITEGFHGGFIPKDIFISYVQAHTRLAPHLRNPYRFARMMVRNLTAMNFEDAFIKSVVPTLLIAGANDPMIDIFRMKAVAKARNGTTLAVSENCGHVPGIEHPEWFNARIKDFETSLLS